MAISFVGSYAGTHAATSAQNVAFSNLKDENNNTPTLQQGDYVIVCVENASTVNRTQAELTPSGYAALHTDDYQNDSNDSNFLVSAKYMGASPDTSVDIPASNATTAGVGYTILVLRGVDQTTAMDVTPVVTGGNNTGIANANAITPSTAGAWVVICAGAAVAAGAVFTIPAGMSGTTNHFRSATITTTTNDANVCFGLKTDWSSGAYDPAAFGGSTSTNTGSWSAVTLAIRPFVSTPTTITVTAAAIDTSEQSIAVNAKTAIPVTTSALTLSPQSVTARTGIAVVAGVIALAAHAVTVLSPTAITVLAATKTLACQPTAIAMRINVVAIAMLLAAQSVTVNAKTRLAVLATDVTLAVQAIVMNARYRLSAVASTIALTAQGITLAAQEAAEEVCSAARALWVGLRL